MSSLLMLGWGAEAVGQGGTTSTAMFTTERWCQDAGTVCWNDQRDVLNGLRIVAELNFGFVFQTGDNRWERGSLSTLSKVALEVNLYRGWISFQVGLFGPGTVTMDRGSPIVRDSLIESADRRVDVDGGLVLALSFLDGALVGGLTKLSFDRRSFKVLEECTAAQTTKCLRRSDFYDGALFFAFQPISSLRSSFKDAEDTSGGN